MPTPITKVPGSLPYSCWPEEGPQKLNVDIVNLMQLYLDQSFPGIYVGPTAPPVDQQDRIWFNTLSTKFYQFVNAGWYRVYEVPASANVEWIWKGTEADLETYAGGSSGAVGDYTGPLWEVDHLIDGRAIVGTGTIPASSPAIVLAQGDTGGEPVHVLTEAEGAVGVHDHAFGLSNTGNDDAYFRKIPAADTVTGYTGYYITGSNGNIEDPLTTADLRTLPSGTDGAGVPAPDGHNNLQPYIARMVIKRTSRIWVQAPY